MLKHVRSSDRWTARAEGEKGFTLIELLVVIIILGILAAVVVLAVNGLQDQGSNNACNTERKTIEAAAAAYYADYDTFPTSQAGLLNPPTATPQPTAYIRDNNYNWTINGNTGEVTGVSVGPGGDTPPSNAACGIT